MAQRSPSPNARTQHVNGLVTDLSSALDSLLIPADPPLVAEPDDDANWSLRKFFYSSYVPFQLADCSPRSVEKHQQVLDRFRFTSAESRGSAI